LAWVAQGKTDAETGVILGISARTVAKHLEQKLGVETQTAAAVRAVEAAHGDGGGELGALATPSGNGPPHSGTGGDPVPAAH